MFISIFCVSLLRVIFRGSAIVLYKVLKTFRVYIIYTSSLLKSIYFLLMCFFLFWGRAFSYMTFEIFYFRGISSIFNFYYSPVVFKFLYYIYDILPSFKTCKISKLADVSISLFCNEIVYQL